MGKNSSVEWCDDTWNIGWGCMFKSEECIHCYAKDFAEKYGFDIWGVGKDRRILSEANWKKPYAWARAAKKDGVVRRVFCGSMMDWTDVEWSEFLPRLWQMWSDTSESLIWLMLTKNHDRLRLSLPDDWNDRWNSTYRNVWLMVSAGNQKWFHTRVPELMKIPAVVHGVSCEPLLGPIALDYMKPEWIIAGGESGPQARKMLPEWARILKVQCYVNDIPFFMKQMGGPRYDKGDDLESIPVDLRVREFPDVKITA